MTEITHHKFSLFKTERIFYPQPLYVGEINHSVVQPCFTYIETFKTLNEAKLAQEKPTY